MKKNTYFRSFGFSGFLLLFIILMASCSNGITDNSTSSSTSNNVSTNNSGKAIFKLIITNSTAQNIWFAGDFNNWTLSAFVVPDSGYIMAAFTNVVLSSNIIKGTSSNRFEAAVCYNNSWGKWPFDGFTWQKCSKGSDGNIEVTCSNGQDVTLIIDDRKLSNLTATIK